MRVNDAPAIISPSKRTVVTVIGAAVFAFVGIFAAQLSRYYASGNVTMTAGHVAPRDIRAPRQIVYISDVETNRQRDLAAASVAPIFSPPDANIARQQLRATREVLNEITSIRSNPSLDLTEKTKQLTSLPDLSIDTSLADRILNINDARWARVDAYITTMLDEVLRSPIRAENLNSIRAALPSQISLEFSPEEAAVIAALATPMLTPNTEYDAAATEAARETARQAVQPIERKYEANQIIVRSGQVMSALDVEALEKLNLSRPNLTWPDVLSAFMLSALAVALIGGAMLHGSGNAPAWSALARHPQRTALSAVLFVAALFLARLLLPGHNLLPFLAPLGAVSIAITSWSGAFAGITSAMVLGGLAAIPLDQPVELSFYYISGGVMACLVLRRGERISDYFRAGLAIAATHIAVVLAFHAGSIVEDGSAAQVGSLLAAALANGLLSAAIAPALLYIAGIVFDIITPIQLIELSRPSHPLLQQLLTCAPGTYHHSLMIANLAEQAAERIGADSLLTRVGAYYHDIGKSLHPYFFIENQIDTGNVHDQLDPQTSSRILQNHVNDGVKLAKRFRLPSRIIAFITEHHGTTRTSYQYALAAQADGEPVDEAGFRYPGPRPQSRETALVMLADGCEAAIRARKPTTPEETEAILRKVISERLADHQLDDVNLTLREMEQVRQSFLDTLRGVYHPRISYPEANRKADPTASLPDAIVPAPRQSPSDAGLALPREQPLQP